MRLINRPQITIVYSPNDWLGWWADGLNGWWDDCLLSGAPPATFHMATLVGEQWRSVAPSSELICISAWRLASTPAPFSWLWARPVAIYSYDYSRGIWDDLVNCRTAPRDGCCVHGIFMEGARWDIQQGIIMESRLKELYPSMPVINIRVSWKCKSGKC